MNSEALPSTRRSLPSPWQAAKGRRAHPPAAPPLRERPPPRPAEPPAVPRSSGGGLQGSRPVPGQRAEDAVLASTRGVRCVGPGPRASGLKPVDLQRTVRGCAFQGEPGSDGASIRVAGVSAAQSLITKEHLKSKALRDTHTRARAPHLFLPRVSARPNTVPSDSQYPGVRSRVPR